MRSARCAVTLSPVLIVPARLTKRVIPGEGRLGDPFGVAIALIPRSVADTVPRVL